MKNKIAQQSALNISSDLESLFLKRIVFDKSKVILDDNEEIKGQRYNNNKDILFRIKQQLYHEKNGQNVETTLNNMSPEEIDSIIIWGIHDAASADFDYQEKAKHDMKKSDLMLSKREINFIKTAIGGDEWIEAERRIIQKLLDRHIITEEQAVNYKPTPEEIEKELIEMFHNEK